MTTNQYISIKRKFLTSAFVTANKLAYVAITINTIALCQLLFPLQLQH